MGMDGWIDSGSCLAESYVTVLKSSQSGGVRKLLCCYSNTREQQEAKDLHVPSPEKSAAVVTFRRRVCSGSGSVSGVIYT